MKVLFVHPDLGVGGAERLVVDMALATKLSGNDVTILTNQYDPNHCFEDTKQLNIIVKANSIPRHIAGRFHAFLAYFKILLASLWIVYFSDLKFDVVVIDQISLPVFVFKLKKIKVLFYCHFPDQLLCVYDKNKNFLKRFYRLPLDWLEMKTTGMADVVLVNSKFTSKIFYQTFCSLKDKKIEVLYPSLNTEIFDALMNQFSQQKSDAKENKESPLNEENISELEKSKNKKFIFLSINRYERKKDLKLAIKAMLSLKEKLSSDQWNSCHLIMAGGYDWRVGENVNHYTELRDLANSLGVDDHISFMRSISDKQKIQLIRQAFCLIYTPTNEHFGIVPIEAMYCEKPVIATNTGGPLETVVDNETGYLVPSKPDEFSAAMLRLISDPSKQQKMGAAARARVIKNFSFLAFQQKLDDVLKQMKSD